MNTSRDPYVLFLERFKNKEERQSYFIGKVTNEMPNLEVTINILDKKITLDKSNFLIDKFLLDRHNISINCSNGSITQNLQDRLNIGDTVLMLKQNDTFIILSKVVGL